jgi:hypothetical protein
MRKETEASKGARGPRFTLDDYGTGLVLRVENDYEDSLIPDDELIRLFNLDLADPKLVQEAREALAQLVPTLNRVDSGPGNSLDGKSYAGVNVPHEYPAHFCQATSCKYPDPVSAYSLKAHDDLEVEVFLCDEHAPRSSGSREAPETT